MAVPELVDSYLASVPGLGARRLAAGEWGLQVPADNAGGEPLDVGLRMTDGMLRAQALALHGASDLDPWMLLWWNRQTRMVRFGCSRSKDIWVHADVAAAEVDEPALDRLLGLVCEAAVAVRDHAAGLRAAPPPG